MHDPKWMIWDMEENRGNRKCALGESKKSLVVKYKMIIMSNLWLKRIGLKALDNIAYKLGCSNQS